MTSSTTEAPPAEPVESEKVTPAAAPPPPRTEVAATTGFLSIIPGQRRMTDDQRAALEAIGITDPGVKFPYANIHLFLHMCQIRGLDPFNKEVYLIRRDGRDGPTFTIQTSIHAFRRLAKETGQFKRRKGIYWTGPEDSDDWWILDKETGIKRRIWVDVWLAKTPPVAAKCIIEHYDETGELTLTDHVANWEFYAQTKAFYNEGKFAGREPTGLWKDGGGPHMLGKCAEAGALRSAFPDRLGSIFTDDELSRADGAAKVDQAAADLAARVAARKAADTGNGTVAGDVIDADVEPSLSDEQVEWLRRELALQAEVTGGDVAVMTQRWAKQHGKPITEASPDELLKYVVSRRRFVVGAVRERFGETIADAYTAAGKVALEHPFGKSESD